MEKRSHVFSLLHPEDKPRWERLQQREDLKGSAAVALSHVLLTHIRGLHTPSDSAATLRLRETSTTDDPPWVQEQASGYVILAGRLQCEIALALGKTSVQCHVVPSEYPRLSEAHVMPTAEETDCHNDMLHLQEHVSQVLGLPTQFSSASTGSHGEIVLTYRSIQELEMFFSLLPAAV